MGLVGTSSELDNDSEYQLSLSHFFESLTGAKANLVEVCEPAFTFFHIHS